MSSDVLERHYQKLAEIRQKHKAKILNQNPDDFDDSETWYTVEGDPIRRGMECFAKMFDSREPNHNWILTIRRAKRDYTCDRCDTRIDKGELHGADLYAHFCLDCVTMR